MSAENGSIGLGDTAIVFSDLFISATAALLLTLAVLNDHPDDKMPPQADIVAQCAENSIVLTPVSEAGDARRHEIKNVADLGEAIEALGIHPRMFQAIALVPVNGTLSMECIDRLLQLVRDWNIAVDDLPAGVAPVVFGMAPAAMAEDGP